ncbi:ABC transporter permease [Streptomyces sp. NPDC091217]|uniref:ABC transporter permease n=1 Tax=Streptomyces sp. NPDC091217 TaxID=3365975 RepID=UPI003822DD43
MISIQHCTVGRVTPLGEWLTPSRLTATVFRTLVSLFLVIILWRALYAHTRESAGLDADQAVTFMVLATLVIRARVSGRWIHRDTMVQHIQYGTILYWFTRPIEPRRYYFVRAMGELAYGLAIALISYVFCLALGLISLPASPSYGAAFAVSLALGQAIFYQIMLTLDLLCFWTVVNASALQIAFFVINLMSGGFAPLWFFPHWFLSMSQWLPFQGLMNTPLSLYIGRISLAEVGWTLGLQLLWASLLCAFSQWLWKRAARRVVVQGG